MRPSGSPLDTHGRPTAALALGLMTGALAALAVVPTAVPLSYRLRSIEESSGLQVVQVAAQAAHDALERSDALPRGAARRYQVDSFVVFESEARPRTDAPDAAGEAEQGAAAPLQAFWTDGLPQPDLLPRTACQPGGPLGTGMIDQRGLRVPWACVTDPQRAVLAVGRGLDPSAARASTGYLVIGLSVIVGLATALGVLQTLSPLSTLTDAVERVGAGERGVRVSTTGLRELDDLVDELNAAARAMEDREDAITARIQVVQELARIVAHEIRNPLQSLELLASLIAIEDEPDEREALAGSIRKELQNLETFVSRMLRGTKGSALRLRRQQTPARDLVEKAATFRRAEARHKGVQLLLGPQSARTIHVDRALANRAIENLVANALAVVEPGTGTVQLETWDDEDGVRFEVHDNGPGVPEDLGDTIWLPEVTRRPGGTGLGLALVRGVIEAHGGYVGHDRSPLGGACFRVWLPMRTPDEEPAGAHLGGG